MDGLDQLSGLQLALLAKRLHRKSDELSILRREPIAIIGLACRFPGSTGDAAAYWQLLTRGATAIGGIPPDRWDQAAYFDSDPNAAGKMYNCQGAFVDEAFRFDAELFGISPREAVRMDPQQRLVLEVAWAALENAGRLSSASTGEPAGVFLAASTDDYSAAFLRTGNPETIDAQTVSGCAPSVLAGRVSYLLGLHGPSLVVDTACSSSLVALHLACQSLRLRECHLALAGGVNLILAPEMSISFCKSGALSLDGLSRPFAAGSTGYVRGEGCGIVVLKRLADAITDGDQVWAVVRGSAVNHGGRAASLTAPSAQAQSAVVRAALTSAGLVPNQIDYVETQAMGVPLADAAEVRALADVFGPNRAAGSSLAIGSVKANIGHLEAAAGVAGIIKVVLAISHQAIPHVPGVGELHPFLADVLGPLRIIGGSPLAWPRCNRPRVAGVSAFGFSGTNAHVVIEEGPELAQSLGSATGGACLLTLSAQTPTALRTLARRYAEHLAGRPSMSLPDLCYTTNVGRRHLRHRLAVVAECTDQTRNALEKLIAGEADDKLFVGDSVMATPATSVTDSSHLDTHATAREQAIRYCLGVDLDWTNWHRSKRFRRVALPTYPFEGERYIAPLAGRRAPHAVTALHGATPRDEDWHSKPITGRRFGRFAAGEQWLIFADAGGLGLRLAEQIEMRGGTVVVVPASPESGGATGDDNLLSSEAYRHLLAKIDESPDLALRGIVYLRGMDVAINKSIAAATDVATVVGGIDVRMPLRVVADMAKRLIDGSLHMWLVTPGDARGTNQPGISDLHAQLFASLAFALRRSPWRLPLTCLQLEESAGEASLELLLDELVAGEDDCQVVLCRAGRFVAGSASLDSAASEAVDAAFASRIQSARLEDSFWDLPHSEQLDLLYKHVRWQVGEALGLSSDRPVPIDQPLVDLGLDSLLAIRLVQALERWIGRALSPADFAEATSISMFVELLAHALRIGQIEEK